MKFKHRKHYHPDPATGGGAEKKTPEQWFAELKGKLEEYQKAVSEKASAADLQNLYKEISDLREKSNDAKFDAMKAEYTAMLKAQGEAIEALKDEAGNLTVKGNHASLSDMIIKGISEKKDEIAKAIKGGPGQSVTFDIKAAGTMTITTNFSGGTVSLSTLEPGFTRIQRRRPFLRQLVNVGRTTSKFVVWVEQANPDPGVADTVAEGATKPLTDFDVVESSKEVRKIAVVIKVSREMVDDLPFIESEIRTELMELAELKLDEQILSGDDNAPNMKGLEAYAQAFNPGATFTNTVVNANRFDVLRVAMAQIEKGNFIADTIILNPQDVAAMELTKDGEGRYLLPPFITADNKMIHGAMIVANNGVTEGDFLVGDFTKANLRIREDINIQVGYENDDFRKNLFTILAELRAVFFVKTNHLAAFVKGTFTDAIAAILQSPVE